MANSTKASESATPSLGGRYLTFLLGGESYGIEVGRTREIVRVPAITVIPQMPEFVLGVVNLRGKIIPIVDLRLKFGIAQTEATERTSVVVTQVTGSSGALVWIGFIVDDVEEVANIPAHDIEAAPDFGARVDTSFIRGMAKTKGKVKTLIDVDRVVSTDFVERAVRLGSAA